MSWRQKVESLMELYSTCKIESDFFHELISMFSNMFPKNSEHSIFLMEERGNLKLFVSTLLDPDETNFLKNEAQKALKHLTGGRRGIELKNKRIGIKNNRMYPLVLPEQEMAGIWVLEEKNRSIFVGKNYELIIHMTAIFMNLYRLDKKCQANYYLDPLTNLPGRVYFTKLMKIFQEKEEEGGILLCGVRLCDFNHIDFSQERDRQLVELANELGELDMGRIFRINSSSFAVVTKLNKVEALARIAKAIDPLSLKMNINSVFVKLEKQMDALKELEKTLFIEGGKKIQENRGKKFTEIKNINAEQRESTKAEEDIDILELIQEEL